MYSRLLVKGEAMDTISKLSEILLIENQIFIKSTAESCVKSKLILHVRFIHDFESSKNQQLILNHICDLTIDFYCMKSQARFTEDFTNHLQNHCMILNKFRVYLLYLHVHVCDMVVESATKDHCNAKKGRKHIPTS